VTLQAKSGWCGGLLEHHPGVVYENHARRVPPSGCPEFTIDRALMEDKLKLAPDGRHGGMALNFHSSNCYLSAGGISTVSMIWMVPLETSTSAVVTLDLFR
jgi:hypothetical protein